MTHPKLEILGPYTPDHEGPFCTRDGRAVRIICTDRRSKGYPARPLVALVDDGNQELYITFEIDGGQGARDTNLDLMNAREVPVAREFWVNDYAEHSLSIFLSKEEAEKYNVCLLRTIHVREVLPGEDA